MRRNQKNRGLEYLLLNLSILYPVVGPVALLLEDDIAGHIEVIQTNEP